jgi:putative addiction module killer protein
METTERSVKEYITAAGRNHFRIWHGGVKDKKVQAKIDIKIARLRLGNFGDSKSLGQGVYELRIHFGPGYRIYYGLDGQKIVLLLCGGDKKTQEKDIKKAKTFWKNYKEGA